MAETFVRLHKFIAQAGLASRRAAEGMIQAGQIRVNGQVVHEPGRKVHLEHDAIEVGSQRVRIRPKVYLALHKPRGYLCTRRDPEKRRTVFHLLPSQYGHIYTVGRLDQDSEGLIFLTNDGEFALRLTHPRYGCCKIYRVTVAGRLDPAVLKRLEKGVKHGHEWLRAARARLVSSSLARSIAEIELREGKNREIRRLFETQGVRVTRLQRTQIGPVALRGLRAGRWRALTAKEISSLLETL